MRINGRAALRAGRDLLCLAGAVALAAFYATERSVYWLLPMSAIVAAAAWLLYRIEAWRAAGRGRALGRLEDSRRRASAAVESLVRESQGHTAEPWREQRIARRKQRRERGRTEWRRRHIGFDPDTGDDRFTWEPEA